MDRELIYKIGELLLLELDGVADVIYTYGKKRLNKLILKMVNGESIVLLLK